MLKLSYYFNIFLTIFNLKVYYFGRLQSTFSFCVRYGMQIDPINMDEMMGPMDIPIQQGFIHSKARIEGIEIHGLGSMALDKVLLLLV